MKEIPVLKPGDHLRVWDHLTSTWSAQGRTQREIAPHSYQVQTEDGLSQRRNRVESHHTSQTKMWTYIIFVQMSQTKLCTLLRLHPSKQRHLTTSSRLVQTDCIRMLQALELQHQLCLKCPADLGPGADWHMGIPGISPVGW